MVDGLEFRAEPTPSRSLLIWRIGSSQPVRQFCFHPSGPVPANNFPNLYYPSVASGNGVLVLSVLYYRYYPGGCALYTSKNSGVTWNATYSDPTILQYSGSVVFGNGVFVFDAQRGAFLTSTDGSSKWFQLANSFSLGTAVIPVFEGQR